MNNKIYYVKKMIGKKIAVIKDYKNFSFWFGVVESVKDENTLLVKDSGDEISEVSIFDIRNPLHDII